MTDLEQIISCPNCHARGWHRTVTNSPWVQCPVCEARGFLVIDGEKTLELEMREVPRSAAHR